MFMFVVFDFRFLICEDEGNGRKFIVLFDVVFGVIEMTRCFFVFVVKVPFLVLLSFVVSFLDANPEFLVGIFVPL